MRASVLPMILATIVAAAGGLAQETAEPRVRHDATCPTACGICDAAQQRALDYLAKHVLDDCRVRSRKPSDPPELEQCARAGEALILALAGWAFRLAPRPEQFAEPLAQISKRLETTLPELGQSRSWAAGALALYYAEGNAQGIDEIDNLGRVAAFVQADQNIEGGWGHGDEPRTGSSYSATLIAASNWCAAALGLCQQAGVEVSPEVVDRVLRLFETVQGQSGAMPYGGPTYLRGYEVGRTTGTLFALAALGKTNASMFSKALHCVRGHVDISTYDSRVRCLDVSDGREIWSFSPFPKKERHATWIQVVRSTPAGVWVHPLGEGMLYRLTPTDGALLQIIEVAEADPQNVWVTWRPWTTWFVCGEHLVMSEGSTLSAIDLTGRRDGKAPLVEGENTIAIENVDGSGSAGAEPKPRVAPSEAPLVGGFWYLGKNAQGMDEYLHEKSGLEFVSIPGGTFTMGSPVDEAYRDDNETQHQVTLSPYLIAKYELTQEVWEKVMGCNPSRVKKDGRYPVDSITWDEAEAFCQQVGLRLPTEAEWEYACRAGTADPHAGVLLDLAWFGGNSPRRQGSCRLGRRAAGPLPGHRPGRARSFLLPVGQDAPHGGRA
ncbi:MAG: SUMF1/EgtB/PvdO family nonheme iron enzyme, partial [Planctomycetota bacterium]